MDKDRLLKYGKDIFPICKPLDCGSRRVVQSKLQFGQRLQLRLFGKLRMPDARYYQTEVYLVIRGAAYAFTYEQGWYKELRVDWE